ncbi:MAG: hypothetical protein AAF497_27830, partial [Planctomycetota bacterium]
MGFQKAIHTWCAGIQAPILEHLDEEIEFVPVLISHAGGPIPSNKSIGDPLPCHHAHRHVGNGDINASPYSASGSRAAG